MEARAHAPEERARQNRGEEPYRQAGVIQKVLPTPKTHQEQKNDRNGGKAGRVRPGFIFWMSGSGLHVHEGKGASG